MSRALLPFLDIRYSSLFIVNDYRREFAAIKHNCVENLFLCYTKLNKNTEIKELIFLFSKIALF